MSSGTAFVSIEGLSKGRQAVSEALEAAASSCGSTGVAEESRLPCGNARIRQGAYTGGAEAAA